LSPELIVDLREKPLEPYWVISPIQGTFSSSDVNLHLSLNENSVEEREGNRITHWGLGSIST